MLDRIANGRTDLVIELLGGGQPATTTDAGGVSLIRWCAYYGDVTAIRMLLANGEALASLGPDYGLNAAAFHGHWRLCEYLLEQGADVNSAEPETDETPLHSALCTTNRAAYDLVLQVLLAAGADPNRATKPDAPTGSFMRDCRTKAETPLHRAAAFGTEATIGLLLDAGARIDARDMHGDTPLGWASWYARPDAVLRLLLYDDYRIHPDRQPMQVSLLGKPKSA